VYATYASHTQVLRTGRGNDIDLWMHRICPAITYLGYHPPQVLDLLHADVAYESACKWFDTIFEHSVIRACAVSASEAMPVHARPEGHRSVIWSTRPSRKAHAPFAAYFESTCTHASPGRTRTSESYRCTTRACCTFRGQHIRATMRGRRPKHWIWSAFYGFLHSVGRQPRLRLHTCNVGACGNAR
jgi:hypothetical protein